jgi:glycerophosphoryl diester phosphodiesterase
MSHAHPPEIIAHRGASRERPENTLSAFRRGVELGADAVELDLHRTSDGRIVVHHDFAVKDETSGALLPLAELTASALAGHRVRGEPIPLLEEVFTALGTDVTVYGELKGADTVAGTLDAIGAAGANAAVHSFDHRLVAAARLLAPDVPRGVLEISYPVDSLHALLEVEGRDLWRHKDFVDEPLIRAAHAAGVRVIAWTVNDVAQMRRFADWGIDAICTDDVALARSTLYG